jgi:hypothetical protein
MDSSWIPLTEYSNKYQVSISTLRRRIKTEDVKFQFADGKYLILDEPQKHRPSPAASPSPLRGSAGLSSDLNVDSALNQEIKSGSHSTDDSVPETVLAVANRLLNELKKAYSQILQEKEEQLLQLKEEQADLKTLVRVLEAENERLSKKR